MTETTSRRSFVFDACLGRGGFGEVYRAKMMTGAGLVSDVAIKVLRVDVDPFSQAIARLRDEGRLLAALNHPAILRVVDLVILEGRIGLVMEYVEGVDLAVAFKDSTPLPLSVLLEITSVLAAALDAAWNAPSPDNAQPMRLVHRDVKPANIRISRHGNIKLLDFGIARSDEMSRDAKTVTDTIIGSPPYMAPERYLEADLRAESDVFALGCCLFEGVARERFHHEASMRRMSTLAVDRIQYQGHLDRRLGVLPDTTPPELVALIRKLLSYRLESRGTAAELAAACDTMREQLGGVTLSRWARERSWPQPVAKGGLFEGRSIDESPMPSPRPVPVVEIDTTPTKAVQRIHTEPGPTIPSEGPTMPLGHGKPSEVPVRRPATAGAREDVNLRRSTPSQPDPDEEETGTGVSGLVVLIPVVGAVLGVLLLFVAGVTGAAVWQAAVVPDEPPSLGTALPSPENTAPSSVVDEPRVATAPIPRKEVRSPVGATMPPARLARVVADLNGFAVWVDGPGGHRALPSELEPGIYAVTARPPNGEAAAPSGEVVVGAGDTVRVLCKDRLDGCKAVVGP